MVASESVALDVAGFTLENDIMPSECLIFTTEDKKVHKKRCGDTRAHTPCLFEYVYLARPDSILDGISIYKSRLRMGDHLGRKILERDLITVSMSFSPRYKRTTNPSGLPSWC